MTGSEWNMIYRLVEARIPKSEVEGLTKEQERHYEAIWNEAVAHEKRYGFWPVFEPVEIDWDDPVLDIYNSTPDEMRKGK